MPEMGRLLPISQILYKNYMYFREWGNYGHTPDTWPWTCDWSVYFSVRPELNIANTQESHTYAGILNFKYLPNTKFEVY